jgi:protein tyrosine phosphatase (PTP) superfamily phosphohydrolase (DUF442 family)
MLTRRLLSMPLAAALLFCLSAGLCSCVGDREVRNSAALVAQAAILQIKNPSSPEPGLLCSGMLTETQFRELSQEGYATFINLRPTSEEGTGWESDFIKGLGGTYINLPISGAAGISEANARKLAAILDEAQRPAALYCGSSNRVGALLGLAKFHLEGASADEAVIYAKQAGMTRLEPVLRKLTATAKN